jgi:hypothetical protein
MHFVDALYLVFVTLALCAVYVALLDFFPRFFAQEGVTSRRNRFLPLFGIIAFSAMAYAMSYSLSDQEFSNRVLHIFGGGFAGFLTCFLAVRNSGVRIRKLQLFVVSVLIVLALGTAHELLEFFLQTYAGIMSATTITDTWLDLTSNVVGMLLASACLVPFHKEVEQSTLARTPSLPLC